MVNNKVIFWRVLSSDEKAKSILKKIETSKTSSQTYYLSKRDYPWVTEYEAGDRFMLVIICYKPVDDKGRDSFVINEAYVSSAVLVEEKGGKKKLLFSDTKPLPSRLSIKNICDLMLLDPRKDYADESYLLFENSSVIADQIRSYVMDPPKPSSVKKPKPSFKAEACSDAACVRAHGDIKCFDGSASPFRKDVIAITNSRAFRRTVDKAQIYGAAKGDLFRTRMTHTQVVAQIALSISRQLDLNLDLTEAIALGHDIGHTPFGHQGERTLDEILKGDRYDIIKNREMLGKKLGFKHNYQSVRVAVTEETCADYPGLNLSLQTLEGMLKHTSVKTSDYDLGFFTDIPAEALFMAPPLAVEEDKAIPSFTLEGQVVAVADEIAQRAHDLDDALLSGDLSLDVFTQYLSITKYKALNSIITEAKKAADKVVENGERPKNETRLVANGIVEGFTRHLVKDVVDNSKKLIEEANGKTFDTIQKLIRFSEKGAEQNTFLENLIKTRIVINNNEVVNFDSNAEAVVAGLFKAYYDNPRLLRSGTKRGIFNAIRKFTPNTIDFEAGSSDVVLAELGLINSLDLSPLTTGNYTVDVVKKLIKAETISGIEKMSADDLKKLKPEDPADLTDNEKEMFDGILREYLDKRRILVRGICDYISGMTDSYALSEYKRIVQNNAKK
ncbi:MAG: dNTP triphosphohydrolase [Clostridia bacterium]|nr:dNTP triphosphohydrolase [Clostridia bacterium]